ncbi:type IV secretion system protein [Dyella psychrodurans]|uniref:Type IV secretion system protein n=2 Tax=Dyella psychrodurans TaxID=1927960 RepID=A0A370X5G0_9GAMM|nr:TrbC/VirB2 family protein [Dyella psychrodurans]RDS83481.1 type IV secretion system protein [Dyella psychrodurans]
MFTFAIIAAVMILPGLALAQGGDTSGTTTTTCGFLTNVQGILNAVSIVVVTIAVIFTGYKVAFAHARISEVAPVLIGAILIGAASQIAKIFLAGSAGGSACSAGLTSHALDHVAAVAHLLTAYA